MCSSPPEASRSWSGHRPGTPVTARLTFPGSWDPGVPINRDHARRGWATKTSHHGRLPGIGGAFKVPPKIEFKILVRSWLKFVVLKMLLTTSHLRVTWRDVGLHPGSSDSAGMVGVGAGGPVASLVPTNAVLLSSVSNDRRGSRCSRRRCSRTRRLASGARWRPQTAGPLAATAAAAGKSKRAQIFCRLQQTLLRDTERSRGSRGSCSRCLDCPPCSGA